MIIYFTKREILKRHLDKNVVNIDSLVNFEKNYLLMV